MYALITTIPIIYPYSYYDLQKDNPQVSFPAEPSDQVLNEWGLVEVFEIPRPECDETTQIALESGCIYNDATEQWEVAWIIRDLTEEELEARLHSDLVS